MNTDFSNSRSSGDLSKTISDLIASLKSSKLNEDFSKANYQKLLEKYEESIQVIESLKSQLDELQKKKLPTKDEVESISSMLDLINKLDPEMIKKINLLGGNKS